MIMQDRVWKVNERRDALLICIQFEYQTKHLEMSGTKATISNLALDLFRAVHSDFKIPGIF